MAAAAAGQMALQGGALLAKETQLDKKAANLCNQALNATGGMIRLVLENLTRFELRLKTGRNWHGKDNECNAPPGTIEPYDIGSWEHCNKMGSLVNPENLWVYDLYDRQLQKYTDKFLVIYSRKNYDSTNQWADVKTGDVDEAIGQVAGAGKLDKARDTVTDTSSGFRCTMTQGVNGRIIIREG